MSHPARVEAAPPKGRPTAARLDAGPTGMRVLPGDPDWDRARAAWVISKDQQPAAVVSVRSARDVAAVVSSAARLRLVVLAQGTGHGAAAVGPLDHAVLLRTTDLARVQVDLDRLTASCQAGVVWGAAATAAERQGLILQAGSSSEVGVAGFLLSGGISWLSRSLGLAVNDVTYMRVVTADGHEQYIDHDHQPDLFWALRGGGGSFAVVTEFGLRLHPTPPLSGGALFYPMDRAGEVLHIWRGGLANLSERTMTCGRLLQLPQLPELPPVLRGQALVTVEVAHQGPLRELRAFLHPLRHLQPALDTVRSLTASQLLTLHMDPPTPTACRGDGMLLNHFSSASIDALVASAGHGSGSPLLSVELRHLGGELGTRPAHAGAMGHLDGDFLLYAVGVTPDAATAVKVDMHVGRIRRALAPWAADLQYPNFDERAGGGRDQFHDRPTLERLEAVKRRFDPDLLFMSSHPLTSHR